MVLFTPATMTAMPGDTVNYTAAFTNTTLSDITISGTTFNSTDPNFFDPNGYGNFGFFNGVNGGPFTLAAGQTQTINDVVSLYLSSSIPPGNYPLSATFTDDIGNDVGTGALNVNITTVPEGNVILHGCWILGVGCWALRRRRSPLQ